MSGGPLSIYGDGEQVRDFIHVSDVVRMTMTAMTTPMAGGEVFNVCTGKATSVRQLADVIVVKKDPIADIGVLRGGRNLAHVIKDGKQVDLGVDADEMLALQAAAE